MEGTGHTSVRLLPIRHDHELAGAVAAEPQSFGCGYQCIGNECLSLWHVPSHPAGHSLGCRADEGREAVMSEKPIMSDVNRREFLTIVAAAQGSFVLGFFVPTQANAQTSPRPAWYEDSKTPEINV